MDGVMKKYLRLKLFYNINIKFTSLSSRIRQIEKDICYENSVNFVQVIFEFPELLETRTKYSLLQSSNILIKS